MSRLPVTIPKQPLLNPAEDYYRLRREGIGFIEQMGSRFWTDYNTHDPGIRSSKRCVTPSPISLTGQAGR